ncbi:MAG: efflux RND transporter periplasmic adaptor subunit [Pseudomonadales bacterium]
MRRFSMAMLPVLLVWGCSPELEPEAPVTRSVLAVQVADIGHLDGRSFPGQARATREVDLAFRVAGPLVEFPVDVGDSVVQDSVVAQIDPRDFEIAVTRAEGQLDRASGALTRARNDYQRLQRVYEDDPGATSQTAIDRAKADFDTARGNVKSLEATLAAAQDALDDTALRAPFDATVVATYVENFEDVRNKQAIVRMVNMDRIEMIVSIPENLIPQASLIEEVMVVFDAFPETTLKAQIKEIGTEASVATRTYPVTLIMDQPEEVTVLAGMAGTATGSTSSPGGDDGSLTIPLAATFSADASGNTYVWVINREAGEADRREVTVGQLSNSGVEVLGGLQAGEWVAVAGVNTLRQGQSVRIANAQVKE